jgi:predicted O-methyltransferase YrrM
LEDATKGINQNPKDSDIAIREMAEKGAKVTALKYVSASPHQREIGLSRADDILAEIERMTKKKFLPIIGPERGSKLAEIVRKTKPKRVLEVGTLIGYSAILIARELENDAHLISIEIHAAEAETARENIRKARVKPAIEVIVGDAVKVIPTLSGDFDLVFVDAEKTEYRKYLQLVEDRLHEGSVVVADNAGIFAGQMKDYLDYVRFSGKYHSHYLPVGNDGLEVSVRL